MIVAFCLRFPPHTAFVCLEVRREGSSISSSEIFKRDNIKEHLGTSVQIYLVVVSGAALASGYGLMIRGLSFNFSTLTCVRNHCVCLLDSFPQGLLALRHLSVFSISFLGTQSTCFHRITFSR